MRLRSESALKSGYMTGYTTLCKIYEMTYWISVVVRMSSRLGVYCIKLPCNYIMYDGDTTQEWHWRRVTVTSRQGDKDLNCKDWDHSGIENAMIEIAIISQAWNIIEESTYSRVVYRVLYISDIALPVRTQQQMTVRIQAQFRILDDEQKPIQSGVIATL